MPEGRKVEMDWISLDSLDSICLRVRQRICWIAKDKKQKWQRGEVDIYCWGLCEQG